MFNLCKKVNDCNDKGDYYAFNYSCAQPAIKFTTDTKVEEVTSGSAVNVKYTVNSDIKCLGTENYAMELTFVCDRDAEEDSMKFDDSATTACKIMVTFTGRKACPIFSLTYLYSKYPYIFAIIFMGAGLLFAFLGLKLFKVVLFLLAAFVVGFVLLTVLYQFILSKYVNQTAFWVCLGISAAVGLTVGWFVASYNKYCFVLAGASLGGIGGFILYTAVLAPFLDAVSSEI